MPCPRLQRSLFVGTVQFLLATSVAQGQRPTRDHYTPSVGVLGEASLLTLDSDGARKYTQQTGWTAGAWFNLPLGFGLSLEPQLRYLSIPTRAAGTVTNRLRPRDLLDNASLGVLSAPLLLKVHVGRFAALSFGGQADYVLRVADTPNYWTTDSISALTFSAAGGVEIMPHSRVTLFGQYNKGLSDLNQATTGASRSRIRVMGAQVGLKVKVFGRRVYRDLAAVGPLNKADPCMEKGGTSQAQGCPAPDADQDGIPDTDDACPKTPGVAAHRGCEPPVVVVLDRDQDGVPDAIDGCPATAGTKALDGCPDRDNDGIEDALDKCPTVAGGSLPRGCPRLDTFSPSAVTFDGESAQLTADGRAELGKVVAYLKTYGNVNAEFVGHTDDRGSLDANIGLSVRRAEVARDFVMRGGIAAERLSARGEGGRRPATSNATFEGRVRNRRIEVVLR